MEGDAVSIMFLPLRLIPVPIQAVVLATVLDLFFSRDKSLAPMLEGLDGKVFHIHVQDMGTDFHMGFSKGKPWVHSAGPDAADVKIDATTAGFARLCFAHEDPDDLVFQRILKLSGDSEAMLRFKKLLAAADIDWERELRATFGEFFGARVADAAKALLVAEAKFTEASRGRLGQCLRDMDVPTNERLQDWQAGVEDASRKLKRLNARLKKLEQASSEKIPEKASEKKKAKRTTRKKPTTRKRKAA